MTTKWDKVLSPKNVNRISSGFYMWFYRVVCEKLLTAMRSFLLITGFLFARVCCKIRSTRGAWRSSPKSNFDRHLMRSEVVSCMMSMRDAELNQLIGNQLISASGRACLRQKSISRDASICFAKGWCYEFHERWKKREDLDFCQNWKVQNVPYVR